MPQRDHHKFPTPPAHLTDPKGQTYTRDALLGKGGFAICYAYKCTNTKQNVAVKVLSKAMLAKSSQKEKIRSEILIHQSLNHPYVVKFFSHFDDADNIYMVIEICNRRSMMELIKRRKSILEPELRYYLHQLLQGCNYLHSNNIIHRDLKLGNLFIDSQINVKIGDFGLATKVAYEGERKKTLCGTPNYIAPEILLKKGHSFEVDIWSLGCIIFTLLVGQAPFETKTLKETYRKIQNVDFELPNMLSSASKELINCIFQYTPTKRPSSLDLLNHPFFMAGFHPVKLPESCLSIAPHFEKLNIQQHRKPLHETNGALPARTQSEILFRNHAQQVHQKVLEKITYNVCDLKRQISSVIDSITMNFATNMDEVEDPAAIPIYWISKWVDYSDKYGFGYQLCDNSHGSLFNDGTQLIFFNHENTYQFIGQDGQEQFYNVVNIHQVEVLIRKTKLVDFFKSYMNERLLYAGQNIPRSVKEDIGRLPYLVHWFRNSDAIVMLLSNATLQINFSADHTKIILCPLMSAVTYIDVDKTSRTFLFSSIQMHKCCSKEIHKRLQFALHACTVMAEALQSGKAKQGLS